MGEYKRIMHTFEPVYDEHSKILILGSLPSVRSREEGFYYGHPQNRFWRVLSSLLGRAEPENMTIEDKKKMLLENGIAIWDVIASCDIIGSSDSTIRNAQPAPVGKILSDSNIDQIFANGRTAQRLYEKYIYPDTEREIIPLPSTSPANAAWSLERLTAYWGEKLGLASQSLSEI